MSLDLYYSNFTNVGDALEQMYQTFLVEDIKFATQSNHIDNGKSTTTAKASENGKVQASLERMSIAGRSEPVKKTPPPRNLRVQIKKPEPSRNGPTPPTTPQKNLPRSPQKSSPPYRNALQSPQKKLSPQELRIKKSSPNNAQRSPESNHERPRPQSINGRDRDPQPQQATAEPSLANGTDENILRQQNSRSSTPSSSNPSKCKTMNNKVYFREENVENLTWNGETSFDGEADDPDASVSPKVNPYSSSFLNFLSSN